MVLRSWIAVGLVLGCAACDTILGLGQYTFDGGGDSAPCTGPAFDDTRLTPFLLPDGGLPPLPAFDGGMDAAMDSAADTGGGG